MLGLQHLNMLHLRGRTGTNTRRTRTETETGKARNGIGRVVGEMETNEVGGDKKKKEADSTEEVGTSDKVRTSGGGVRLMKDKANRKMKSKTRTWSDVVKGLKVEDELETANSDKCWNKSEATDSKEEFDLEELNQQKAKRTRTRRD